MKRKISNNIFNRFHIILLVCILPLFSYGAPYEGYYITMNGDTVYAIFRVKKATMSGVPNYARIQKDIKCKTKNRDKYITTDAEIVNKLIINVDNEQIEFLSFPNNGRLNFIAQKKHVFLRPNLWAGNTMLTNITIHIQPLHHHREVPILF